MYSLKIASPWRRVGSARSVLLLAGGIAIGACVTNALKSSRPVFASPAGVGDHSSLISCTIRTEFNDASKVQIPVEGVVYLDYRRGKLVGTMPEMRQIGLQKRILGNFTERDLTEDFGIEPGADPHFLMTSIHTGALSDGGQLLVVLDTQSRKTRVYKLNFEQQGFEFKPQFTMMEKKVFDPQTNIDAARLINAGRPPSNPLQTGP